MIAEAIKAIGALANDALKQQFVDVPGFPQKTAVLLPSGDYEFENHLPTPRGAVLSGLEDLCRYVLDSEICASPEIYIGASNIAMFLDRKTRHETACLPLVASSRYAALCDIKNGKGMEIKEAIDFLRFNINLAEATEPVISSLRNIDFKVTRDSNSVIEHGKESLGRKVDMAVAQAEKIPETLDVEFPTLSHPDFAELSKGTFTITIGIQMESQKIVLRSFKDAIAQHDAKVIKVIKAKVIKECPNVPVFCGTHAPPA